MPRLLGTCALLAVTSCGAPRTSSNGAPPSPPVAAPTASPASGGPSGGIDGCARDVDCQVVSRAALGCCAQCSRLEAMTAARRDAIARLCGLDRGGERCPPMAPVQCPVEEPSAWRPACVAGRCVLVAASTPASRR